MEQLFSTSPSVYSAFGERIAGANPTPATRYGYAGEWGYQEHDDFPFQHVGARYYDPSTGRFMQRDPIGIDGGLSVYGYVRNLPTTRIDPSGTWWSLRKPTMRDAKDALTVAKKVAELVATKDSKNPLSKVGVCARPITAVADAAQAGPDAARCAIACKYRGVTALNPDKDINDALDDYDRSLGRWKKPGKGE